MDSSSFRHLLATTSVTALLIAAAGPAVAGSCTPVGATFTNSSTITCITVTNTSFTGSVSNNGTISAGSAAGTNTAIAISGSTITGSINDNGTIRAPSGYAIAVDSTSKIAAGASRTAITVSASPLIGGISNAGTLSGAEGISVFAGSTSSGALVFMSTFTGGITNSGTIAASGGGIAVAGVSTFAGGISNSGTISGVLSDGISAVQVRTFIGGITNSGTLTGPLIAAVISTFIGGIDNTGSIADSTSGRFAGAIDVNVIGTFAGGIANEGHITSNRPGIRVGLATSSGLQGVTNFSGGISNSGTISARTNGIIIAGVATFSGKVSNSGTISSTTLAGIENVSSTLDGIVNAAGGTISAANGAGILLTDRSTTAEHAGPAPVSGAIINAGIINAKTGIAITGGGTVVGGVTNSGNLTGSTAAIDLTREGAATTITNSAGTISGNILLSNKGDTVNQTGGTINGSIIGRTGTGLINFTLGAGSQTFGPSTNITNVGTIAVNSGTLILDSPSNSDFATQINGGALIIGDSSHSTAVLNALSTGGVTVAGGTLAGYGTIIGNITNTGGIVAPGGAIGTLSATSYMQNAGGTLRIEVSPTGASKLNVTGAASLNGTLALLYDPGVYTLRTYNIVHAGSLTGTFTTVNSSGSVPANLASSIAYDSTDADLVLANPPPPAPAPLVVAPTHDSVFGALGTTALLGGQQANDTLLGHLADSHSGTGSDTIETALASTAPTQLAFNGGAQHLSDAVAQLPDAMAQLGGWFRAIGSFANLSGTRSVPGFDTQGGGFMAGLDRPIAPNLTAGVAGGYSHTNLTQHDSESGTLDTPRVAAYGSYVMGPWAFDATVGYAYDRIAEDRPIAGIGTASAHHDAHEATGAAQASYRFDYAGFAVMPNAGLTYVHLFDGGFDEGGAGGFALDVSHRNADSLRPFVGVSASEPMTTASGMRLVPEADIRYSHELFVTAPALVSVGGGGFAVNGLTPAHDELTVGGGITAAMTDRLALFADYHAILPTGNYWQQTVSAGVSYKF